MSNLLVIDFDFFFPERNASDEQGLLYDWNHSESMLFIEALWPMRAAGFLANDLPLPGTSGLERGFWDRFSFDPDARLYVAESNAKAADVAITNRLVNPFGFGLESVWLYDAHHDSGYRLPDDNWLAVVNEGRYSCENWMLLYAALGADLHVRYPAWKTWAFDADPTPPIAVDRTWDAADNGPDVSFDTVFVCRSGAWVPPWLDEAFFAFLADAPFATHVDLQADEYPLRPRPFNELEVQTHVQASQAAQAMTQAMTRQVGA